MAFSKINLWYKIAVQSEFAGIFFYWVCAVVATCMHQNTIDFNFQSFAKCCNYWAGCFGLLVQLKQWDLRYLNVHVELHVRQGSYLNNSHLIHKKSYFKGKYNSSHHLSENSFEDKFTVAWELACFKKTNCWCLITWVKYGPFSLSSRPISRSTGFNKTQNCVIRYSITSWVHIVVRRGQKKVFICVTIKRSSSNLFIQSSMKWCFEPYAFITRSISKCII